LRPNEEARLEPAQSGLVPVTAGWFVVNIRDAAWLSNEAFGLRAVFEGSAPALRGRPDLEGHTFEQIGLTLAVLAPERPSGLYHADSNQEDFLVLAGECLLIIEGEERPLRAWDFVHCPPGTGHVFVGAGEGPCVILMTGARTPEKKTVYPRSEPAAGHGASVEAETSSASEAYAAYPHWQPERPTSWAGLPWHPQAARRSAGR
jgi:uncharacterized cupin superfamily protein